MTRITTLVENRVSGQNLKCEHGLSFHIETEEQSILFDTGQSGKFIENAARLGIDLSMVDAVVLSHGHYDHTGGLTDFFRINDHALVYLHPKALKQRYSRSSKMVKANGIPWRDEWQQDAHRFVFVDQPIILSNEIHLLPNIEALPGYEVINPRLVVENNDQLLPDRFEDELILVIKNKEMNPVLFCGCAHNGIVNILHHVKNQLGYDRFELVIGGLHLSGQPMEEIQKVIDGVSGFQVEQWGLNHCTGNEAIQQFAHAFPGKVIQANTGSSFEV